MTGEFLPTDPAIRATVLVTSLGLSCTFLALFFLLRYAYQRLRRVAAAAETEEEEAPLLSAAPVGAVAADHSAETSRHITEEEKEEEATGGDTVVVPVWDGGHVFFRAVSTQRASPSQQQTPPSREGSSGGGGGGGESPVPHRSARLRDYGTHHDNAWASKEQPTEKAARQLPLPAGSAAAVRNALSAVTREERDIREGMERGEVLARTSLRLALERDLLHTTVAARDALAKDVADLNAFRETFEQTVMPAIFNDLQSAAEELADSETAMLTAVDHRQHVLRVMEAHSAAQGGALLSRLSTLVSQVNGGMSAGRPPSSSAGTPRPSLSSQVPTPRPGPA